MSRRHLASLALVTAVTLTAAGCGADSDPLAGGSGDDAATGADAGAVAVGSANFPESELLAEIYAQALEDEGVEVSRSFNIGARELYLQALEDGSIDLLPEYNGALLSALTEGGVPEGISDSEEVYAALPDALPEGTIVLEQSEAEDKDTVTVRRETAEEYGLETIGDLAPVAGELVAGAGPEWQERYQGLPGLEEVYGLEFGEFRPLDAGGPLTVGALADGTIDAANLFSTDSAITQNDFVVLEDPENLFLAENIVPLIRESAATPTVVDALNEVSAALTTENLTEYLAKVQVDRQDTATVATEFLAEYDLA
ncbi:ABC transporter substrate-binding protein [uncultured Pseudokineococcus sp.]|uniref:ABC transporter substrate-binding protein n=1 Tax=uncultured Pseudokineococcus sp. TaxID=1642928 RepID=UPI002616A09F|nr:ABC transporter substrate-binding protein [uncultured Pseudokineococcus sp.]